MIFYFLKSVDSLHFLQVNCPCQSFVFPFPALVRALSAETAVRKLGQRQLHYVRRFETNTAHVGRSGGAR